jgi:hypothetical protein
MPTPNAPQRRYLSKNRRRKILLVLPTLVVGVVTCAAVAPPVSAKPTKPRHPSGP